MCCPVDQLSSPTFDPRERSINFTPKNFSSRVARCFQRMELFEKIFEIADESFHLFGSILKNYCSQNIYQFANGIHNAAHTIEHFLHSFCFLGDLSRIWMNKTILEYRHERGHAKKID